MKRACVGCGKQFVPLHGLQVYCLERCPARVEAERVRQRAKYLRRWADPVYREQHRTHQREYMREYRKPVITTRKTGRKRAVPAGE